MTAFVYPVLAVFFTCVLLRTIQSGTLFHWFGRTRFLRFFGKYSYGMYVYHVLFFPLASKILRPAQQLMHSQVLGGLLYVFVVLALTCVVSVLSFQLYERPWLRLKSRFSYSKPRNSASKLAAAS
jgi:peptidoglycan/LPS O-acetylase OafA/YrhL